MPVLSYFGQFCLPPSGLAELERHLVNKVLRLPVNTLAKRAFLDLENTSCWRLGCVVALVVAAYTRTALRWQDA